MFVTIFKMDFSGIPIGTGTRKPEIFRFKTNNYGWYLTAQVVYLFAQVIYYI